ncbi:glucohydrolase [Clostridium sp. MCC353]|uniref:alpha-glucosidase n=1 Tax=Clostridium sp. MCC353 TaxID=2592646 RepID=UPI001C02095C|nr:alpha-glucosidase [Clostridium sp. MCC353]MBT9775194.1 glucohydrolase [Clostridium sp. MCC353]
MEQKWWHNKTAYQVYPKSFYDSNGDGTGDIRGIIEKLDYLKELGIEILWLSPVYLSPCADQGYDIADYYQIDPQFGTMEDMDTLLLEAEKRQIHVLMDLVVNHCSDEHEWFKKACEDPEGEYGRFFYMEKAEDGKMPCNWRSYFGGPVWERVPGTDYYYLHLFHKKQPDLNWENPKLRESIYRMVNWWLEKGLAGFRIDAIINIKKPLPFKDYPADREDGLCDMGQVLADAEGIGTFLGELRDRTFKPHDAFTVGEVFNEKEEELPEFIGENGYFSSMFDFRETVEGKSPSGWYDCKKPTPEDYKRCCFESQRRSEGVGYLANVIENHDEPRGVSHYLPKYAQNERGKKLLAILYFMLKGIPFIYQGQELGMENTVFHSIDEVDDIGSKDEYRRCLEVGYSESEALKIISHYSRDNARTPFQWTDGENAGFTKGRPWITVNPDYIEINAKEQMDRRDSVYSLYRELIALRKNPLYEETIVYGRTEPVLTEETDIMAYFRRGEAQEILVLGNFDSRERTVVLEETGDREDQMEVLINNCPALRTEMGRFTLEPCQAVVIAYRKHG